MTTTINADVINAGTALQVGGKSIGSGVLEVATALNTVGAGTITAAGIVGAVTTRGGAQSGAAFTDTTDTAANIIAALPGAAIGEAFEWTYQNNTNGVATLTGGTGVTVSAVTIVPGGLWARFLVTYTAAATVTIVGIAMGSNATLPPAQFSTAALSSSVATAGQLSGAAITVMQNSGATPGTYTTRTAAQMFADIPNCYVGLSYLLIVGNAQATGTLTLAGGTNVTITGTATIAANTSRMFTATFTSATALTLQDVGGAITNP